MEHPTVTLVASSPDPERLVCAAAKLCYAADADTVFTHEPGEVERFLKRLRAMGHLSPFEHASFTFLLEGVSRALTHQLVRHRVASYSQRSQRYVGHDRFEYITPPALEGKTVATPDGPMDAVAFYHRHMETSAEAYRLLCDALSVDSPTGEKVREDARYVLPNAAETKIMVTMNARELFHFFQERLCRRAQWEIRRAAGRMLDLAREAAPLIFTGMGPKCIVTGHCPEGKLSCGKFEEVKREYGKG